MATPAVTAAEILRKSLRCETEGSPEPSGGRSGIEGVQRIGISSEEINSERRGISVGFVAKTAFAESQQICYDIHIIPLVLCSPVNQNQDPVTGTFPYCFSSSPS
jgi:hypothetical protein